MKTLLQLYSFVSSVLFNSENEKSESEDGFKRPGSHVAQARNMSIGEHRHCGVTFEIKGFVWGKNLSFLRK